QVLLTRVVSDLMQHILDLEAKKKIAFKWKDSSVIGLILASKGYPVNYEKGKTVSGFDLNYNNIVSGLYRDKVNFVSKCGLVILVLVESHDITSAKANAYKAAEKIQSDGLFYRKDISNKAIKHL